MIEWEIDKTYRECGNERRMSGHMIKEMKGSFIYRNENTLNRLIRRIQVKRESIKSVSNVSNSLILPEATFLKFEIFIKDKAANL